jgi:hypothetical protein
MKALVAALCFAAIAGQAQASDVELIDQGVVKAAGGFPFKITRPGSYRLTGPLTVPATSNGLMIDAPNVLLDLNGFTITCRGGQFSGITSDDTTLTFVNVKIRHGAVSGCGYAVNFVSLIQDAEIEDFVASNYGPVGIALQQGAVRRSETTGGNGNGTLGGSAGIQLASGGIVDSNRVQGDNVGIETGSAAIITNNVVIANTTAIIAFNNGGLVALIGSNSIFSPGDGRFSGGRSQGNNTCNNFPC